VDIRKVFETGQSRANLLKIVEYIGGDAARFRELMRLFFNGDGRMAQCAAWPMSVCAETQPQLLRPYLGKLIGRLKANGDHSGVTRNIVRLLQYVEIPKRLQGKAYSHCLDLIADPEQPIGVKAFAITVARNIANAESALMDELRLVVKPLHENASPGLKVRLRDLR
jgi:hypothetical protein